MCYNKSMLELKNISKIYTSDEVELRALDEVSLNLRRNEFVSILGPSGSGKTTLLNIIGGLDHYTSGNIIIDGVSTKNYKDRDWDAYRNHRVGFVFQSYNLIQHQSVLANVELALTLSGVSGSEKKKRATEALEKVGLGDHLNKRPSQLSGGQMQRVAIARALVNNPDIILADEPTGALDSKTSIQIMDLLKEIAKDKLVVMVTHNPDLAKAYSTRIINLKDGRLTGDSDPFDGKDEEKPARQKSHTSLSLLTALQLSKNNLMTKRGRTILTAIAGSIGIIGIALILALANGVNKLAANAMNGGSTVPAITVPKTYVSESSSSQATFSAEKKSEKAHDDSLLAVDDLSSNFSITTHRQVGYNDLKTLKSYLDAHTSELKNYVETVHYDYGVKLDVLDKDEQGNVIKINPVDGSDDSGLASLLSSSENKELTEADLIKSSFKEIVTNLPYKVLSGHLPEKDNELLLVVDGKNELPLSVMYALNLKSRSELAEIIAELNSGKSHDFSDASFSLDDYLGKTYRVSLDGSLDYDTAYEVKIAGIAKVKDENDESGYLGYTHGLVEKVIAASDDYSLDDPSTISLIAKTQDGKEKITTFLDNYNNQASDSEKVKYSDDAQAIIDTIKKIVDALSYVLIGFVAISLVVSSIMIGIITYISVLERTKEIGILRAIGASKRDVIRVFRAETIIEGFAAGLLGVVISWLLCSLINAIVSFAAHIDTIADFSPLQAAILILISVALTVFAGASPAKRASKKDPVEALRSE